MKITAADKSVEGVLAFLPEELRGENNRRARFGKRAITVALWVNALRPVFTLAIVFAISATGVMAQNTNPFGTRGDQSLGNLVSNILKIAAWLALAIGILSFMAIPISIKMKWDWMSNIWAGLFGVGGWAIAGSLGYMLANNQDTNLPELGN